MRWERMIALDAGQEVVDALLPYCERITIAGSIRRQKPSVGDVEILYVPKLSYHGQMTFDQEKLPRYPLTDGVLTKLIEQGVIRRRKSVKGFEAWGMKNKLALHVSSGIPIDLFATTIENWFMSLVIRTGGKQTNIEIATAASRRGLHLHPYTDGFTVRRTGEKIHCGSEEEVFRTVGLPCLPPEQRK